MPSPRGWPPCSRNARAEEVTFHNPLQDKPFTQTVYLANKRA